MGNYWEKRSRAHEKKCLNQSWSSQIMIMERYNQKNITLSMICMVNVFITAKMVIRRLSIFIKTAIRIVFSVIIMIMVIYIGSGISKLKAANITDLKHDTIEMGTRIMNIFIKMEIGIVYKENITKMAI